VDGIRIETLVSCLLIGNSEHGSYLSSTRTLPGRAVAEAISAELPDLVEAVIGAIQSEVEVYRRPLAGEFGERIRDGAEVALGRLLGAAGEDSREVYRALGRGEHRAGRTLDALQAAYRVGARVAWTRMSEIAAGVGADAAAQRRLAGAMFAYIEEIAAESVEGYTEAQLEQAGELERQRAALAALLISLPAPDEATTARAAATASWRVPATVAAVAVDAAIAAPVRRRLQSDVIATQAGALACLLVPDPSAVAAAARAAAERIGATLGLGPSVALADARGSWRLAQLAHELGGGRARAVLAEDRMADLAVLAARDVLPALGERALRPFREETHSSARRLAETLRWWLALRGSQSAVARELGVHPQTVRYRVRRLRELFGAQLEDPDRRFELELALRWRALRR
jgi:PucR C-terminal helix-turn-helix domain